MSNRPNNARYRSTSSHHRKKPKYKPSASSTNIGAVKDGQPRIVAKRYNVTSQTAYHIRDLAFKEGLTEGRVIDKIIRMYLASIEVKV